MKAHRTDVLSLVFGLLFLVVALGFTAQELFDVRLPDISYFIAGGAILVGLVVAVTAMIPHRKPSEESKDAEQV
jgi:hypothetical protein